MSRRAAGGNPIRQRTRKLIGVPLLGAIIIGWAAGATLIYEALFIGAPGWLAIAYFAVAGFGWFVPAALAIRWMQSPG